MGSLTLGALGLRLVNLTRFEIWVDEAATWHFALLAASGHLLDQVRLEPTPPLYYALIGFLMRLAGESDFVLRLPSAVIGAAAVPAVFALGRAFFGRGTGYVAALLLAVHPLHVFYSREARVYPLLLLEALLLWLFLRRAIADDRWRSWALFAGTLLAACYSHFYGLFLGATSGVLIVAWRRWRGLVAAGLAGLVFLPYLLFTLPHLRQSGAAWSIELMYELLPDEKRLGRTLEMGFVGAEYTKSLRQMARPTPPWVRWPSLLAQIGLVFLAFAGARRRGDVAGFAFLTAAWLLPLLIPWTVNHWRAIYQIGRHDFYALGTLSVILAAGLAEIFRIERRGMKVLGVIVVLVLGTAVAQRLTALHRLPATDWNRSVGAWIAARATESDRVMAMGIRRLVTEHYARLAGSEAPFESFPASTDGHPGWSDTETLLEDEEELHREGRGRVAELAGELAPDATLFVLVRSYRRTESAVSADWMVDRHLLENLAAAGWRPAAEASDSRLAVMAFRPPLRDRGQP